MKLNLKELREKKNSKVISSKEALNDVIKFDWNEDVLCGEKKVIVK
ncbi:MAG: hypothetical protein ACRC28_12450 [Clostridium sp.]